MSGIIPGNSEGGGGSGGVVIANNGLSGDGTVGTPVVLGGDLLENTFINPNGKQIAIGGLIITGSKTQSNETPSAATDLVRLQDIGVAAGGAQNGLQFTGGKYQWGGNPLLATTNVDLNGQSFQFTDADGNVQSFHGTYMQLALASGLNVYFQNNGISYVGTSGVLMQFSLDPTFGGTNVYDGNVMEFQSPVRSSVVPTDPLDLVRKSDLPDDAIIRAQGSIIGTVNSGNILTFANGGIGDIVLRVNAVLIVRSVGVGTATINVGYTDSTGTARVSQMVTAAAAGAPLAPASSISTQQGTAVTIDLVITGTITVDVYAYVESIF